MSRRARDLGLMHSKGVLDLEQLAFASFLRDKIKANVVMEVTSTRNMSVSRHFDRWKGPGQGAEGLRDS